jgi:putative drug exporter of the RND superfamily
VSAPTLAPPVLPPSEHRAPITDAGWLARLGRRCFRHSGRVLALWAVAMVGFIVLSGVVGTGYRSQFGDLNTESRRGFELLAAGFPEGNAGGDSGTLVFRADSGVTDAAVQTEMEAFFAKVAAIEVPGRPNEPLVVQSPYQPGGEQLVSAAGPLAGKVAYAQVLFPADLTQADFVAIAKEVREAKPVGGATQVELGGEVFAEFAPPESEILGLGAAIVILILAFGSVLAMGLPIGMALAGIGTGIGVVGLLSNLTTMPEFTTSLAVMIGLGVGIDYALFIVTRYRELIHHGSSFEDAAAEALDTAGRAVLFAGTTVVISLMGMLLMGVEFVRGLAIGASVTVLFTLAASITLLPALLGLAKHRIELTRVRGLIAAGAVALALMLLGLKVAPLAALALVVVAVVVLIAGFFVPALKRPIKQRAVKPLRETGWYRWSRVIQHHPWISAATGFVILIVLSVPVLSLRLGFSDTGNYREETTTRKAYDLLAEGFGPGFNGPLVLAASVPAEPNAAVLASVTQIAQAKTIDGQPAVAFASPAELNAAGDTAQWIVVPTSGPQDAETYDLVKQLRSDLDTVAGVDVQVTGFVATGVDFSTYLAARLPLFFGAVLALSFLLLMVVFRSILVPLKAVIMNLLSIGASYGIIVAIFQWGWGISLIGIGKAGPIEPFMPMMLFAIVFGLSMDYEVFLLSRMKEEFDRTGDNASAVADGLAVTARVITAAAAIMVVVFGAFVLEEDRVIKLFGIGLASAVFLDATIVRMLLVPATMELLGNKNWWMPKWLDRLLPKVDVEGHHSTAATTD